jgi:hypothetical protein
LDLRVPYAEKDEAKALGARWDPTRRCWYVPPGLDTKPFQRWIVPSDPRVNLRASEAYVVTARRPCWRCRQPTVVVGFLLAPGFEDLVVWEDDADGETREWRSYDGWGFAHYLDVLPDGIAHQAQALAPRYRHAYSKTTDSRYWANHCDACGVLQGDFHLFEEPGEPFMPLDHDDIAGHRALRLRGVFEASGGFNYSIDIAAEISGVRGNRPKPPRGRLVKMTVAARPATSPPPSFWRRCLDWFSGRFRH